MAHVNAERPGPTKPLLNPGPLYRAMCLGFVVPLVAIVLSSFTTPGPPTPAARLTHGMSVELRQAADQRAGPRVLLFGGSSVAHGLRAEMVEAASGLASANCGLHAGLSLDYQLRYVRSVARTGDVVVLAIEYPLYNYSLTPSPFMVDYVLWMDPSFLSTKPALRQVQYRLSLPFEKRLLALLLPSGGEEPARWRVNRWGDAVENRAPKSVLIRRLYAQYKPRTDLRLSMHGRAELRTFLDDLATRGISKVFVTFPPLVQHRAYETPEFRETSSRFRADLASLGLEPLGDPLEFTYPVDLFYDTLLHLTDAGARHRTETLLRHLLPLLEKS